MTREDLIRKFIEFFKRKNHEEIGNASLIPENDPIVLFTTAGMQPLVPYLLGKKHPLGNRLCNVQKCIRTTDIEEVGNTTHHTFFEMLGNWSLNDYFKEEAIKYSYEFLTEELKIQKEKLAISCFGGDENAPKDKESERIWKEIGMPEERIAFLPKEENWWETAGNGPCGPDTEMFYYIGDGSPKKFDPEDNNWVEIWNDVFMEYNKKGKDIYEKSQQKNVDTGMGLERMLAILSESTDNYQTHLFKPIIKEIEKLSDKSYENNEETKRSMRIIADHIKATVFILAEKITPSNEGQGYIARRLIRRTIRYGRQLNLKNFTSEIAKKVFEIYPDYKYLEKNKEFIIGELKEEEKNFSKTLKKGINEFKKIVSKTEKKIIPGNDAFLLYQSFGFPIEMTEELAKEERIEVDKKGFEKAKKEHKEKSKSEKKFKSGLADHSEETKKLHTATHLLHKALRKILGDHVEQRGSNINEERLRFDFSHTKSLEEEEKKRIEDIVNNWIKRELRIKKEEMSPEEARKKGAIGLFDKKYGEIVSVYTVYDPETNEEISKEICEGPHIKNTKELKSFEIYKEESSSKGVRRIKAKIGQNG